MRKIILSATLCTVLLSANSSIYLNSGIKDYTNSKTKIDGETNSVGINHKYENTLISLNYTKDEVNRIYPVKLNIEKYNVNYRYYFDDKLSFKINYIKILDNLAPTDQGKVYGAGITYTYTKGLGSSFDTYKSDYKDFNVNQYDLSIYKGFKIGDIKSKFIVSTKMIKIDGDKYGLYSFQDKNYLTTGIKLNSSYNGYIGSIGTFFGKRAFAVLKNGTKVQHHAMAQDKTYMASFGKKFHNFDLIVSYSYQNGKELPENQDDVDTKVTSLMLKYKF